MANSDYLRKQAQLLRQWARGCFDMKTAEHLRLKADEFEARTDQDDDIPPAFMSRGNDHSGDMEQRLGSS